MSDPESLAHDAMVEAAQDRISRINAARRRRALAGPPGDPPNELCEHGLEECLRCDHEHRYADCALCGEAFCISCDPEHRPACREANRA